MYELSRGVPARPGVCYSRLPYIRVKTVIGNWQDSPQDQQAYSSKALIVPKFDIPRNGPQVLLRYRAILIENISGFLELVSNPHLYPSLIMDPPSGILAGIPRIPGRVRLRGSAGGNVRYHFIRAICLSEKRS
jgi:hypothetical protein